MDLVEKLYILTIDVVTIYEEIGKRNLCTILLDVKCNDLDLVPHFVRDQTRMDPHDALFVNCGCMRGSINLKWP